MNRFKLLIDKQMQQPNVVSRGLRPLAHDTDQLEMQIRLQKKKSNGRGRHL
jgi:hypothetical protein